MEKSELLSLFTVVKQERKKMQTKFEHGLLPFCWVYKTNFFYFLKYLSSFDFIMPYF